MCSSDLETKLGLAGEHLSSTIWREGQKKAKYGERTIVRKEIEYKNIDQAYVTPEAQRPLSLHTHTLTHSHTQAHALSQEDPPPPTEEASKEDSRTMTSVPGVVSVPRPSRQALGGWPEELPCSGSSPAPPQKKNNTRAFS